MLNPEMGSNVPFLGSEFIVLRSNFRVFPLTQDHCGFSRGTQREQSPPRRFSGATAEAMLGR
jgi:hypothetical protein